MSRIFKSRIFESPRRNGKTTLAKQLQSAIKSASHTGEAASSSPTQTKLEISINPECKIWIDELSNELKKTCDIITKFNQSRGADGLLAALQADAANDADGDAGDSSDDDDLLELGQWVFEGCDPMWTHAAIDSNGSAYRYTAQPTPPSSDSPGWWLIDQPSTYTKIDGNFDASDWRNSVIEREPVNDVDFDENPDNSKSMEIEFLGIDLATGASVDCFGVIGDNTPSLTKADLQRMHSLDRFSSKDIAIHLDEFMPWDIIILWTDNGTLKRYAIFGSDTLNPLDLALARTIDEDEIQEFREWAEVHYV